jgi:hypothetical protein
MPEKPGMGSLKNSSLQGCGDRDRMADRSRAGNDDQAELAGDGLVKHVGTATAYVVFVAGILCGNCMCSNAERRDVERCDAIFQTGWAAQSRGAVVERYGSGGCCVRGGSDGCLEGDACSGGYLGGGRGKADARWQWSCATTPAATHKTG